MRKIIITLIAIIFTIFTAKADGENGYNYITSAVGFSFNNTGTTQFSYEKPLNYDVSLSIDGELGYRFNKLCVTDTLNNTFRYKQYYWDGGLTAKKTVIRYKNSILRAFLGAHAGAYRKDFFIGIDGGFEWCYIFRNEIQFFIQQKNQVNFIHNDTFKNGILLGFKIPL